MMYKDFITKEEMDGITEKVLVNSGASILWQGEVIKTDIDKLIEFGFGLDIIWENIDHFDKSSDVLAAIVPSQKAIYMNETKKDLFLRKMGTMNFSKAHELGHWILHVTEMKDFQQLSFSDGFRFYCRGGSKRPPQEIQADMFAASILMPRNIISGAVNELKECGKVGFPELYSLKDKFEVSISALTNRISDLGLLYFLDKKVFLSKAEATGQLHLF